MTPLMDFLLARIAEDEDAARDLGRALRDRGPAPRRHDEISARHRAEWPSFWRAFDRYPDPARVLAECDAKRRIVEQYGLYATAEYADYDGGYASASEDAMRALALPHADHPDYREEWRP